MKYIKIISFAILSSVQLNAQDTLKIVSGDGIVNGSFIEPYTNSWNVYLQTPDGSETHIRYWTDYTQLLVEDSIVILNRVQDLYSADGSLQSTWINVVEQESLKPKKFTLHSPSGALFSLQFENGKIVSGSNQNGESIFSSDTSQVSKKLYDWNLYGILLVGLPFDEGKVYEFEYWSAQNKLPETLYATIGTSKVVETLSGEKIQSREVSTSDGFTFSLSKKAPYVIKLVWDLPNGNKMIWRKL